MVHMTANVPVIDLGGLQANVVREVRNACTSSGFFLIKNHHVDAALTAQHFEFNKCFFTLPTEQKEAIRVNSLNRGWTPHQEETLDPSAQTQGDTKEGLYFGREVDAESPEAALPLHGPNQWPSEDLLPGYRQAISAYFEALLALGRRLLHLLALSLELPETWFDDKFDKPIALLRPLHYSGQVSQPDQGIFGAGAHTDYGMLTILATDGSPGLQIYQGGKWHNVDIASDRFCINLGDMLERWTNGMYKSTLHRVISISGRDRYSAAFFYEPSFNTVVECLPQCCSQHDPPKFRPTTSGQHLLDKYAATHADYSAAAKEN